MRTSRATSLSFGSLRTGHIQFSWRKRYTFGYYAKSRKQPLDNPISATSQLVRY
jgi:hypothetical protein